MAHTATSAENANPPAMSAATVAIAKTAPEAERAKSSNQRDAAVSGVEGWLPLTMIYVPRKSLCIDRIGGKRQRRSLAFRCCRQDSSETAVAARELRERRGEIIAPEIRP